MTCLIDLSGLCLLSRSSSYLGLLLFSSLDFDAVLRSRKGSQVAQLEITCPITKAMEDIKYHRLLSFSQLTICRVGAMAEWLSA